MSQPTEEMQENLKIEDVFEEVDRQLIDELTVFIEEYQQSKTYYREQLQTIQNEALGETSQLNNQQLNLMAEQLILNENDGSPQNQEDGGEVKQNDLLFQQLRQMIQTYENLHNIQDISEVYKNLSLTNEGQVQIENHDPEMIKKLKELINSEDRDQLI